MNIFVIYNDTSEVVEMTTSATVYDLKKELQERFHIKPENQQWVGEGIMPMEQLTNDVCLVIFGGYVCLLLILLYLLSMRMCFVFCLY